MDDLNSIRLNQAYNDFENLCVAHSLTVVEVIYILRLLEFRTLGEVNNQLGGGFE